MESFTERRKVELPHLPTERRKVAASKQLALFILTQQEHAPCCDFKPPLKRRGIDTGHGA